LPVFPRVTVAVARKPAVPAAVRLVARRPADWIAVAIFVWVFRLGLVAAVKGGGGVMHEMVVAGLEPFGQLKVTVGNFVGSGSMKPDPTSWRGVPPRAEPLVGVSASRTGAGLAP
jgi:hypothetical protein